MSHRSTLQGLLRQCKADPDDATRLVLAEVAELSVEITRLSGGLASALAGSPHLTNLRRLEVNADRANGPALKALLGSPHLDGLVALNLWGCSISPAGFRALAASPLL